MATEFVGIELQLLGAAEVRRDLQSLDSILNSFRGRKKFDVGFDEARKKVVAYRGELERLRREQAKYEKNSDQWKAIGGEIDFVKNKLRDAQQAVREFGLASRQAGQTFMQTFNSFSSKIAHLGSAMQSFGNAVTRLASPFGRLVDGVVLGAGFKVANSFTEGIENGFNRYDTMKKFPRIMKAFGYDEKESQKSIDALDKSVRGLPTGLDEMVDLTQRFTATTGDLTKGTKLAIATNNAFLASMSTDTQKYQGMMQLQDVLGGKDMNAREWNSLVSSMTPAIVKMGEAMQKSGEWSGSIGDFIQYVRDGKMDNQKFIDQLIKIGNKGGALEKMAQESKNTWQAFFANVGNAASRMTAGVIESMDEVVKSLNLKDKDGIEIDSVNMLLSQKFIPAIDNATKSIKKWIKAHPEEIKQFFKDLSKIDFKSIAKGFAQGLGDIANTIHFIAKLLGGKDLSLIGRFLGNGRMIGATSTIIGGLLKGLRHPLAALGTVLVRGGKWIGTFLGGKAIAKVGKSGLFGKILSIFGKKKDLVDARETAKEIPTVASTFRNAFKALEGLIKAAGAVLLVGTTGMIAFKEVKEILKDLKDIHGILNEMTWVDAAIGADVALGITALAGALKYIGEAMSKEGLLYEAIGSLSVVLAGGTITALAWEAKATFDGIKNTIDTFMDIANELSGFQPPEINTRGIINTVQKINAIYAFLSGEGMQRNNPLSMAGKMLGFVKNPVASLLGSVAKGAGKSIDATSTATKYAAILETVKNLKTIAEKLNELSGVEVSDSAVASVENIADAVNKMISKVSTWTGKISGPENLVTNTSNYAKAFQQMKKMANRINALAGTTVNTSGFAGFIEQLKGALESLKDVQGDLELDITVKLNAGFEKSVNDTISKIKTAKKNIEKQKKGVSFSIPVKVTFSVTTNFGAALLGILNLKDKLKQAGGGSSYTPTGYVNRDTPTTPAKGGMIYRARGGGVPNFRRRGTDTVPAMLTPGEYVHNKRAVNTFGIDFMRKVNNLDMKGAMNELMHRAGGMANVNRGTVITNNTYNNQKVNITNNGNPSAGFTFKSASRFVGAF